MKLLITPFLQSSSHFPHLDSNIPLSILLSNTLNQCFSLNMKDQYPYKTTAYNFVYFNLCTSTLQMGT
jgi:hypothetical protein